ncbi:hypothetical protein T439DRAFT_329200, partial [Meredithblackwellia eburnea MCA 4105]
MSNKKKGTHEGALKDLSENAQTTIMETFIPFINAGCSRINDKKFAIEVHGQEEERSTLVEARRLLEHHSDQLPHGTIMKDLERWYNALYRNKKERRGQFTPEVPFLTFEQLGAQQKHEFSKFFEERLKERPIPGENRVGADAEGVRARDAMFAKVANIPGGVTVTMDNLNRIWQNKMHYAKAHASSTAAIFDPSARKRKGPVQVDRTTPPKHSVPVNKKSSYVGTEAVPFDPQSRHVPAFENLTPDQQHLLVKFALEQLSRNHAASSSTAHQHQAPPSKLAMFQQLRGIHGGSQFNDADFDHILTLKMQSFEADQQNRHVQLGPDPAKDIHFHHLHANQQKILTDLAQRRIDYTKWEKGVRSGPNAHKMVLPQQLQHSTVEKEHMKETFDRIRKTPGGLDIDDKNLHRILSRKMVSLKQDAGHYYEDRNKKTTQH